MTPGAVCSGGKVSLMSWRKCLVVLTLVLLIAGALPVQASEPRASHSPFGAVWQLILKFMPSYSTAPPTPPQKSDADTGSGSDPSGFVGTSGPEVPTTGFDSSPAIDPDGNERSPAADPDGAS
jgi:hypothetical protein